jgi:hypothetical protein
MNVKSAAHYIKKKKKKGTQYGLTSSTWNEYVVFWDVALCTLYDIEEKIRYVPVVPKVGCTTPGDGGITYRGTKMRGGCRGALEVGPSEHIVH